MLNMLFKTTFEISLYEFHSFTLNMSKYFFICTEATDNPNEKNSGATAERGKYKSSLNLLSLFIDWIHKKTTDFNFGS